MNKYYKGFLFGLTLAGSVLMTRCSDEDYIEANTDPDVLSEVSPENQFLSASLSMSGNDFEWFYDYYQRIMPWMQYLTPTGGNAANYTRNIDNFSKRYDRLYIGVGNALYDMEQLVANLPAEEQARYVHMLNISRIVRAYYAFYVADIYGSVVYTQAWQARYGGTLTPAYDDQRTVFLKVNEDLAAAVDVLKTSQTATQVSLGNYDIYYGGDVQSWIRAANAVRLRLALRLQERESATAKGIIDEVLAQPATDLMSENAHGWVLKANSGFTAGGNWNPDLLYAGKPLVDFMYNENDPRIDAFFSPNGYSQVNIDTLIDQGKLDAGTLEDRRYFGSFTNPDEASLASNDKFYERRTFDFGDRTLTIDTISKIQRRLFQPAFDEGAGVGEGQVYMPILTYAEFCFMRAEIAARTLSSENAADLYNKGVTASIEWYNKAAVDGQLSNYTPIQDGDIDAYLLEPGVAYNPAIALDQISSQAYINFFKYATEGWAWWKRTGMPNANTVLELPAPETGGVALPIPRRAPLPLLTDIAPNFTNQKAAYDALLSDPAFGATPNDVFGRVWWDQQ